MPKAKEFDPAEWAQKQLPAVRRTCCVCDLPATKAAVDAVLAEMRAGRAKVSMGQLHRMLKAEYGFTASWSGLRLHLINHTDWTTVNALRVAA